MKGIADTGFLVAFANRHDRHHEWAVSVASQVNEPLLTCEAVLAEAAFHLQSVSTVLAMVRAPRRGEVRRALEPVLGRERCAALQATLIVQTIAWANAVAPGGVHIAHEPADARGEISRLSGTDAALFPQNGEGIAGRLAGIDGRVMPPVAGRRRLELRFSAGQQMPAPDGRTLAARLDRIGFEPEPSRLARP